MMSDELRIEVADRVATLTLNRPERKNPLTFELYAELRDWFRAAGDDPAVRAVVLTGAEGNFCSGGDVHEIIGQLVGRSMPELLAFTRMTGALVDAMVSCPCPIVAAVDGVAAGAGAILAMASDIRLATPAATTAFLFTRVGLAGCDMGACAILPRIVGQGRAAELLLTGRSLDAEEGERCGFYSRLVPADELLAEAQSVAASLAHGPTFAHAMTKAMLRQEWALGLDEALEAEAQAQAVCMRTKDFERAYRAFAARERPVFEGD
jgi:enoyl-CoA hydratase/carnithine racemase